MYVPQPKFYLPRPGGQCLMLSADSNGIVKYLGFVYLLLMFFFDFMISLLLLFFVYFYLYINTSFHIPVYFKRRIRW